MTAPAEFAGPASDRNLRRRSMIGAATLVTACMLLTAACSSSSKGNGSNTKANTAPASSAASSTPATSQPAEDKIAGTWKGTFTGSTSSGTFTIVFTQQGDNVAGKITIDGAQGGTGTISGKLSGKSIAFGSIVGSTVTFNGSFSGNSMSGLFKSATNSGGWKATR